MSAVIKVENLSKAYQLGEFSTGTLSMDIERWWLKIRGKEDRFLKIDEANDRSVKGISDFVWSLKNVSFNIEQGDAVGIIGRNGAGKSTLLKILSRVTTPTSGSVKVKGRIASLLEVGTGFHPELTGRENIYLNGAILGMRKYEIKKRFDEIVSFSGVERYIDTPVKRYSSGMYVRLAFAVAAHLEPEILIVDEVLAVGDADFQKKCIGKMSDVSKNDGRTILFVSHNMAAVSNLCNKSIFLQRGVVIGEGDTKQIIDQYITAGKENSGEILKGKIQYNRKCPYAYFNSIRILSKNEVTNSVGIDEAINIEVEFTVVKDDVLISPSIHILDNLGTTILATFNAPSASLGLDAFYGMPLKKGSYKSVCTIPGNFLNDTTYSISAFLVPENANEMAIVQEVLSFSVVETGKMRKEYTGGWIGMIRPKMNWKTEYLKPQNGYIK